MMCEKNGKNEFWNIDLESKPDFDICMKRIYAWFEGEIIDRVPVRFSGHNSEYDIVDENNSKWNNLRDRWMDTEYQVEKFIRSIKNKTYIGETFPVFWPNLGPNVYAAFYGISMEFGEATSWAEPIINNYEGINKLKLNMNNEYMSKLDEMTKYALERCKGKFMVGYTDLHPGFDCVAAWRGTENMCLDFYDYPEQLKKILKVSMNDFQNIYDHFDSMLKEKKQPSVTWMNIPSFGKLHIPSCDFSAMISNEQFDEFYLPLLKEEVKPMTHNIYHVDGKGVAKHIDRILQIPEIDAIQWVQGVGDDKPIMQWVPFIKKIQNSGKSVVVDLDKSEIEDFISSMKPEGLLLCIDSKDEDEEKEILKRIEKW